MPPARVKVPLEGKAFVVVKICSKHGAKFGLDGRILMIVVLGGAGAGDGPGVGPLTHSQNCDHTAFCSRLLTFVTPLFQSLVPIARLSNAVASAAVNVGIAGGSVVQKEAVNIGGNVRSGITGINHGDSTSTSRSAINADVYATLAATPDLTCDEPPPHKAVTDTSKLRAELLAKSCLQVLLNVAIPWSKTPLSRFG